MVPIDKGQTARVRDLCRRLKPIINEQAERIWRGYLVEDDAGKTQILEYLELVFSQHFHGHLDEESPALFPLPAKEAYGEYPLGAVSYNGKALHPFGLREGEFCQHIGIFGRSGAGKTNLGFLLVKRLLEKNKPILIFDWKRNYRDLLELPEFQGMAVYTIGRAVSPFKFNPLIPPAGTNPKTWLKKIISVIAHSYLLGDGVIFLLQEAIDRIYEEAGVYGGSVERWPTLRDVFRVLKERQASGREAGWMSSALRALAALCFGEMDVLVNQGHQDLKHLLTRPVVLELDALTQSDKVFFIQTLLLWIHHYRMTEGTREQFKHTVLIEEAHHVLSGERQSLVGGQSVMDLTFREIRELGESCVAIDQCPSQISMSALGNTYSTICFNLKHRSDVSAMAQAMLLKENDKDVLGKLEVGQAVVRLQGRGKGAFTIDVPEFSIEKGKVTDADVVYHMTRLGLLPSRDLPASGTRHIVADETRASKEDHSAFAAVAVNSSVSGEPRPSQIHELALAFLHDVERYSASGIAERYKRLSLSVRQGQKLKERLIEEKRITEHVEMTRVGKLRLIRLTESGKGVLRENDDEGSAVA